MAEKPASDASQSDSGDDEKTLESARTRFKLAAAAENTLRLLMLEDLRFSAGDQWPDEIKRQRGIDSRPCLVINRMPQFIRQITNDQRQNRPSIQVDPVDDKGDPEIAEIQQGIVRHIEYASGADVAYDTGFEYAVRIGRGWWRVITDYCDPLSFDQEILIKRIANPFVVYPDPAFREPDGCDMNFCFLVKDMTKEEYASDYPQSEVANIADFKTVGDSMPDWFPNGGVRVAEYFYIEMKDVELVRFSDGSVLTSDQADKMAAHLEKSGVKEDKRRKSQIPQVKWCLINGKEILERRDWPGVYIPVVPVIGEELEIDGERHLAGIIRNAKDPQRMLNYWKSAETEAIALAPRAPFVGAEGQFEGHEAAWKTANVKNHAFLQYKPKSVDGVPLAPPQRQVFEPAVQAITGASMQAAQDIKDTTGIYDASLGNRSNETSGVAIQRRNQQAQTANFHYVDNLTRSIRHTGRILIDLIPKIYDTARAVRIIGADGEQNIQLVNQVLSEGKDAGKSYHLSSGKYDVVVETGPSYATRRQEAVASMLDFIKAYPGGAQLIGDLLAKNMDWPGATEIADRLKKALPPGIAEAEDGSQPLPPEVKQKMDQMSQTVQQLSQHLHAAQDELDQKKLEMESRERIAALQAQTQIAIAESKAMSGESIALLNAQMGAIQHRLDLLHEANAIDAGAQYDAQSQAQDQAHQMAMAQQQQLQAGPQGAVSEQPTGGESPGSPNGEIQ